jgi:hypothetical protein
MQQTRAITMQWLQEHQWWIAGLIWCSQTTAHRHAWLEVVVQRSRHEKAPWFGWHVCCSDVGFDRRLPDLAGRDLRGLVPVRMGRHGHNWILVLNYRADKSM